MDVSYKPKDWVDMKDGLNQITKDTFVKLHQANGLLKDVQERIHDLDSDGSIYFHHKDQTETIAELHVAYTTLQKYCDDAGGVVYDHIDKPFLVTMDQFAQKMRDLSIKNFETTNRIGSTTTTTVPGSYSYGNTPQTITTTKPKITVDDIFKDSRAFDKVLHAEYEEWKRKDPNMKLEYEEYRKRVPSTRGFEYRSIEDEQKQLEAWRDFGLGVLTVGAMFICPPLGVAASLVFGGLQVKSAHDGEDWGTHRKLSQGEKVERYVSGGLDVFTGGVGGIVKGFKTLGSFGKLQGEVTSFKPNAGKNMVQSLQDGKNITLDRMRLAGLKAEKYGNEKMYQLGGKMAGGVDYVTATLKGVEAAEDGTLIGKQAGPGKVTEWVNARHAESSKKINDEIQGIEVSLAERIGNGSSGVSGAKGTGNTNHPVRVYRDINDSVLNKEYEIITRKGTFVTKIVADEKLVVDMPYIGKGKQSTNSEGWLRDNKYYFNELYKLHPEYFSDANIKNLNNGWAIVNDAVFRRHFPQYDIVGLKGKPLVHHHIGGGGQAMAIPQPLHPGSGGIHNIEKQIGIWGKDQGNAERLQVFIK
ncbi:hypothetical protein RGU76_12260 [Bacillus pseudomycoides]|uniref:hypothetical protein n=1 Tax=Bacillus TaxID=1386 RepID=UPI00036CBDD7|nr:MULTISPECIES: hypothetical protein [Bacillus]MCX2824453.1 hypothetical protein [Bacillus sp. DHT2]MDR4915811.1 hypothetical protein [Bacillus pseudomycoides]